MSKSYSPCPKAVHDIVKELLKKFYPALLKHKVTVDLLFACSDSEAPAVSLAGYPCQAVVRVVNVKDRSKGLADVEIVIDERNYDKLTEDQRFALLDHELYHVTLKFDAGKIIKRDSADRPCLGMRKHDRQIGWFDEIARRHGDNSAEIIQARALIAEGGQTYFAFALPAKSARAA